MKKKVNTNYTMKTQKIKNIKIISLAVLMTTFTMFSSLANSNNFDKKNIEDTIKVDNDSIKKRLSELENLISELMYKWNDLRELIDSEYESEVVIEDWMFDDEYFSEETADESNIEEWML